MRRRRFVVATFALSLLAASAAMVAPAAQAGALPSPVDPEIEDGQPNSLRDVLENQVVDGDTVVLEAGATYVLTDCEAGDVDVAANVTIEGNGATIEQTCQDRVLDTDYDLTIHDTTITGGRTSGEGGAIRTWSPLTLVGVTLRGNQSESDGGAIDASSHVLVVDSLIVDNATGYQGGAIDTSEGGQTVRIVRSTLADNCAVVGGGAVSGQEGDDWTFVNSTVTRNTSGVLGAIDLADVGGDLTLVYTDVVANELVAEIDCGVDIEATAAGGEESGDSERGDVGAAEVGTEGANVDFGQSSGSTFTVFGSVIAQPVGAPNCGTLNATVTSLGYSFSDDDSCQLTGTGDRENAGDPMLGALAYNGGPTPTLLPQPGSPLIDAIPSDACGLGDDAAGEAVTTDQRLLPRPDVVSGRCDIGSVEIQTAPPEPLVPLIEPRFTG